MLSTLILSLALASSTHSTEALKDYTISRAMDYNVSPVLAVSIIKAESNFDIDAKNTTSTASGLAQYINGTFSGFCIDRYRLTDTMKEKNNPYVQIECLVLMLSEGGVGHWSESKGAWSKLVGEG